MHDCNSFWELCDIIEAGYGVLDTDAFEELEVASGLVYNSNALPWDKELKDFTTQLGRQCWIGCIMWLLLVVLG
eukprot:11887281-Karenia_brevis.AAC.1